MNTKLALHLLLVLSLVTLAGSILVRAKRDATGSGTTPTAGPPPPAAEEVVATHQKEWIRPHSTTPEGEQDPVRQAAINAREDPWNHYNPFVMTGNPEYRAKIRKHQRLKYYYHSPARETPECEKIRMLLAQEGVGLDAVADAYNAVWNYWIDRRMEERAHGAAANVEMIDALFREPKVAELTAQYGITNAAFYDALFDIQPKVFFERIEKVPFTVGEKLLVE